MIEYVFIVVAIINGMFQEPKPVPTEEACIGIAHRLTERLAQSQRISGEGICFRFAEVDGVKKGWFMNEMGTWVPVEIQKEETIEQ